MTALTPPVVRASAADAFANALARLGNASGNNLMSGTQYIPSRLSRDYNLLNTLYRTHWIVKKIVETIPQDMCKNWFSITANLTPEQTDRIDKLVQKTKVKEKIFEALCWGRLYGGAAAIIMLEGHEDVLEEPLELDDIGPNSFKGLMVVDRWSGVFPGLELITDLSDPDLGLPLHYEIRDLTSGNALTRVHHSRVIRCIGRALPFWENLAEIHWGASEVEHVFDELTKRDNTSWNIASLVFQANLIVNTVDGLDQVNAMGDPQMQADLYNVKSAQNQMRSSQGMMLIGERDKVEAIQYQFSGLNDIYESFMLDIAGASEIPVTRLFGRSPAGMNATGESDLQNYYDMIARQQEDNLKPKLNKLLPILFMSEFGVVPPDLAVKANPVRTPSDEQMADLVSKKVAAICMAYEKGLISQRIGLSELHELSYNTNMFSSITYDHIEAADDTMQPKMDMPGFGGDMLSGLEADTPGGRPVQTKPEPTDGAGVGAGKPDS